MTQRWKITIEYDGAAYHGWQKQDDVPSVQQAIQEALYGFCQQDITVQGAGRTDAGVHACGQAAHFDLDYGDRPLTGFDLAKALNAHLRPQRISIIEAEAVHPAFHARFDAAGKLYRYRILNGPAPPALVHGQVWHYKQALDAGAMHEAAQILVGHHDFTTFRDSQCQARSPVKTLDRLSVSTAGATFHGRDELWIEAEGQSFLHHQVRNMVGSLVLVGTGKWGLQDMRMALAARDRTRGGPTAPAHGLYLMHVEYPQS